MLIFLDLEETLIDEWANGFLLLPKVDLVKALIAQMRMQTETVRVGLMSWAVWDEKDKVKFNNDLRDFLETNLKCTFDSELTWSMDEWCKEVWKCTNKKVDRTDIFELLDKEAILCLFAKKHPLFKNETVLFIDDTATHNMSVLVPERNCVLKCLNINAMMLE